MPSNPILDINYNSIKKKDINYKKKNLEEDTETKCGTWTHMVKIMQPPNEPPVLYSFSFPPFPPQTSPLSQSLALLVEM